ncbi:MAG: PAS domain-containing sensor histidine kinase [Gemmatimonadota bacterium]
MLTTSPSPWLQALVANVQDAIVVLDASGQVIFESPSACDTLGVPPTDSAGVFRMERIHPDERDAVIDSFERTIAVSGSVARATYRFRRADGSWQHLEAVAKNLLNDPRFGGVLITLRDVTERTLALEAAERAGRARDEFLARMSHELRTPIHAILGWAELLIAADATEIEEGVVQITAAGKHLLRLVEDALDVAAVQEGRVTLDITPVDISEVVTEAIDLVHPLAVRRDVRIHLASECVGTRVMADRGRLRQVVLNLLSNAVKYNRYAGDVRIRWEHPTCNQRRIYVTDSGPGLPENALPRVFDRFERLGMEKAGIEGNGLGLAISNRLIEMMGGTLGVRSEPGAGAEFWIDLPAG